MRHVLLRMGFIFHLFTLLNGPVFCQEPVLKPVVFKKDAVVLDAEKIYPFYNGFARIEKGNLVAIIDRKGAFVLPYGNFRVDSDRNFYSNDGNPVEFSDFFTFYNEKTGVWGFITRTGKVNYLPKNIYFSSYFNKEGKALARSTLYTDKNIYLVDSSAKIKVLRPLSFIPQKVVGTTSDKIELRTDISLPYPCFDEVKTNQFGYVDLYTGKFKIQPNYAKVRPFFEGMAAVSQIDKFGTELWGFIDLSGKLVIPCKYRNEPERFSCGLAKVTAVDKSDYSVAFINKEGEIVFTLSSEKFSTSPNQWPSVVPFQMGYTYFMGKKYGEEFYIVDTLGKIVELYDYLSSKGYKSIQKVQRLYIKAMVDGKLYMEASSGLNGKLIYDFERNQFNMLNGPVNRSVPETYNYDRTSGLRHFIYVERVDNGSSYKETEGYINDNNEFVIVIGKGAKW